MKSKVGIKVLFLSVVVQGRTKINYGILNRVPDVGWEKQGILNSVPDVG